MPTHPRAVRSSDDIAAVKRLVGQGVSRADIAGQLPGRSRSSVCSLCCLLKIGMPVARLKLTKALRSQPTKRKPVWDSEIGKVLRPVWKPPSLELPIELLVSAVSLNDLDLDACCQWPISGEGRATPFCGANRNDSDHPSYCQHHAARSIKVETVMPSRDMLGTLRNDSQSPNQTQPA